MGRNDEEGKNLGILCWFFLIVIAFVIIGWVQDSDRKSKTISIMEETVVRQEEELSELRNIIDILQEELSFYEE